MDFGEFIQDLYKTFIRYIRPYFRKFNTCGLWADNTDTIHSGKVQFLVQTDSPFLTDYKLGLISVDQ